MEPYSRSQEALANSSDELVFAVPSDKKSKGVKKKTKSLNKKNKASSKTADPAVVRTSSLPNVLDDPADAFMDFDRGRTDPHGRTIF